MPPRASIRRLLNSAWIVAYSREQARFKDALSRVAETQQQHLRNLLRRNARTRFGKRHSFAHIRSVADYQKRVPITAYDVLTPDIEAIARGEAEVLTSEPVRLFQPTSGSTAGTKLIPWTAASAGEFRSAIAPWIAALYQRKPALLRGTAYWSVSPPTTALQTHGRLRVGFAHDAEYLGFVGRKLFSLVNAVPADLAQCRDPREFRTRTLLSLLADADLSLISVWSPTFLTTLLEHFVTHRDAILERLSECGCPAAKRRAEFLRATSSEGVDSAFFEKVWPDLQVISCWTHGPSEIYAENLRRLFPTVEIQGKGLVATEGFVSLPVQEGLDPVLAVASHFFEFQHL
ncbi:MAG TPA: GH3 auxin-responsive promoter family protein, partial [Bacillota bacterium]|nr:GH3 auxin-responsive promoter family protein [Bacillota bacterium]